MASQLEKQLGVAAGKYTTSQLAQLKGAEGNKRRFNQLKEKFARAEKPKEKSDTKKTTKAPATKPSSKPSPSRKSEPKKTPMKESKIETTTLPKQGDKFVEKIGASIPKVGKPSTGGPARAGKPNPKPKAGPKTPTSSADALAGHKNRPPRREAWIERSKAGASNPATQKWNK